MKFLLIKPQKNLSSINIHHGNPNSISINQIIETLTSNGYIYISKTISNLDYINENTSINYYQTYYKTYNEILNRISRCEMNILKFIKKFKRL